MPLHSKLSSTSFQPSYLLEFPWVKEHPSIKTMAICSWCNKGISISGMGKTALKSHSKSAKHILNEKNRQKSLLLNMFFKDNVADSISLSGEPSSSRDQGAIGIQLAQASGTESSLRQPSHTTVSTSRPQSTVKQYVISESVTR
ncbi:hypothetical protein J6590_019465 [Homalodisca vitripennis]|nr:hypothetical protein J6590_019465 [Homalodisca vitripennis]